VLAVAIASEEEDSRIYIPAEQSRRRQCPQGRGEERTQPKNPLTKTTTERNKRGGQFMAVKKTAKKFKGFAGRNKWAKRSSSRRRC
jgi:hypothetical protein